jgi:CDP-diacylglycerol pyrophosphatase
MLLKLLPDGGLMRDDEDVVLLLNGREKTTQPFHHVHIALSLQV